MDRETPAFSDSPVSSGRRPGHTALQRALVGVGMLVGIGMSMAVLKECHSQDRPVQPASGDVLSKLNLFKNWDKPDLVIVLTGEQHGYLQPCGCTSPQYGGLTRRYNLFQALWQRGWPTVAVDLGDIPAEKQGPQVLLKYRYSMMALHKMQYGAVGIGQLECNLPLSDAMAETLNNPAPKVLCANLVRTNQQGQMFQGTVFDMELVKAVQKDNKAPKIGVVGLAGKGLEAKVKDSNVKFDGPHTPDVLVKSLQQAKAGGADLMVLLYEGGIKDAKACATWCQQKHEAKHKVDPKLPPMPHVDMILCLADDSLPPAMPDNVGNTLIVTVGHKGQHVGVIGAFRAGNANRPFDLRYQMVRVDPEFETPVGKEAKNELNQLMEMYSKEVKDHNYLAQYKKSAHEVQLAFPQAEYVGSETCKACHKAAFAIWEKTPHAHAYKTLVDAKNPSLRQFDGECLKCHTIGFDYKTGYTDEATDLKNGTMLKDVGCESCHGPCSEHVAKPGNTQIHLAINKYKFRGPAPEAALAKEHRQLQIDIFCQKCHDLENDNHFDFAKKWSKIEHMMPAAKVGANSGPQIGAGKKE